MVVSLTIIPVLAARYLARRPIPTTGPIYNLLASRYEGLLRVGLRFPKLTVLLAILVVIPGWFIFDHLETGFMPEMDEGALVIDYEMPVGTSLAQTDKVLRRVESVLLRYARRGRLHPPHRSRTRILRDRVLHRRYPGQSQAARGAAAGCRNLRRLAGGTRDHGPRAGDRADSADPGPDWRPGGCRVADRGQGFRPGPRRAARSGDPGRRSRRRDARRGGRQSARIPGQSRHHRAARQRADRARGLERNGHRDAAQCRALRSGRQHDPGTGSHDQDSRALSRPRAIRQGSLGAVAHQLGHRHRRYDHDARRVSARPAWDLCRCRNWRRSMSSAAPTNCGAKTSSR